MTSNTSGAIAAEGNALKVRIFYSHSANDQAHQESLEKHLAILRRQGSIEEWHNRKILAGERWDYRIKKELVEADIILLLLTPDFIASKYCYSTEMTFAIQAAEKGLAIVIPLLIRTSGWQNTPLARLQALPRNGESIYENATPATSSSHFEALLDREWQKIAKEITKRVEQLLASPDDLLKNRQMRLALESNERSEVWQRKPSGTTRISQLEKKKKSFPLLLVVSVALLLVGFGGASLLHWMPESMHVPPESISNRSTPVLTKVPTSKGTIPETTGGNAGTWTDYSSGGGNPGPIIPSHTTVQITCKVTGFKVEDGDTWWYRIASRPWDNKYYVSADAFYNNGQTSGSFTTSLLVDNKVPNC
jgi:hypothetical protein